MVFSFFRCPETASCYFSYLRDIQFLLPALAYHSPSSCLGLRMEPSQIFGGGEECHSSESGWTMYIGSPVDDDDGHSGEHRDNDNSDVEGTHVDAEDESDDSMASDASSRPWGGGQGRHGLADFQQVAEEENEDKKNCLDKNGNKAQEKQIEGKRVEKKEKIFIDRKGKTQAQGNDKVRKNYLLEK